MFAFTSSSSRSVVGLAAEKAIEVAKNLLHFVIHSAFEVKGF